uniref:Uncharacterized protein n=1 Tax=Arundo donax TaxID=35708 RepID=A0A0A9AX61_ARUDO
MSMERHTPPNMRPLRMLFLLLWNTVCKSVVVVLSTTTTSELGSCSQNTTNYLTS